MARNDVRTRWDRTSIVPVELMDRYTKERHIAYHSLSRLIIRTKRLLSNLRLLVIIPVCLIIIQDVELIVDVALGSGDICLDSKLSRALPGMELTNSPTG
jgi:hypothetical protein